MATYIKPSISNYNDNPPTNDGSTNFTDNGVDWDLHINEIGDPLKNFSNAANNAADTAFTRITSQNAINVKDAPYNAVGDGVTDDTTAIQAALNIGKSVYIPDGTYKITATLTLPTNSSIGYLVYGDGPGQSIIQCTGMTGSDGVKKSAAADLMRVTLRDFAIKGDSDTALNLNGTGTGWITESQFTSLDLESVASDAFKCNLEFNIEINNVHVNSTNGHGFNLQGGNTTTLISCYAHNIPKTGKAGFKIEGGAVLISCNGLDSGETWGYFGASVVDGDAANIQYDIVMINCNVEDFTVRGINCRFNGWLNIIGGQLSLPAAGTVSEYIRIDFCDHIIELHNTRFDTKGATITSPSNIYAENAIEIINYGNDHPDYYRLDITTLVSMPSITGKFHSGSIGSINIPYISGLYTPRELTWTPDATTFSITGNDRVTTANTVATAFTNATGATRGQELIILVKDANTTINNLSGGTGQFSLVKGANYAASNGDALKFLYDVSSGIWREYKQTV